MLLYDMVSRIEDRELQNTTENVIIWYGIHNRRQRVTKYNRKCYYMIWYPLQKTVSYKIQQKMLLYDMVSTTEHRKLQNTTENVII